MSILLACVSAQRTVFWEARKGSWDSMAKYCHCLTGRRASQTWAAFRGFMRPKRTSINRPYCLAGFEKLRFHCFKMPLIRVLETSGQEEIGI